MTTLSWLGILLCLSQSALLSGLNIGLFSLGKLELKIEAEKGDARAGRILRLREDANFALVTILWGNVGVNILLALLSGSVFGGISAFLFSTVIITLFAEIIPQAYFTRHALRMTSAIIPVLRLYQIILWPVARPTAWALDAWLGGEEIRYLREHDLRRVIHLHMEAAESDIALVEGQGALNFLELDDISLVDEGQSVDPESIIIMDFEGQRPLFPRIKPDIDDSFLLAINRSGKSWIVIADRRKEPRLVLKSDDFIREALFSPQAFSACRHCHRPIIAKNGGEKLGELIRRFRVHPESEQDDIVDDDVILLWNDSPRILTSTDILGRLLRGIALSSPPPALPPRPDQAVRP